MVRKEDSKVGDQKRVAALRVKGLKVMGGIEDTAKVSESDRSG